MNRQIFVNLPIRDLMKSIAFFKPVGFSINPQFTDDTAACVVISEHIHAMLLTHAKFCEFTPKTICDTTKAAEVLLCLTCESRANVDEMVQRAVEAGGSTYAPPKDYGFMYQHGFQDIDGHTWELIYMEPGAVCQETIAALTQP